MKKQLNLKGIVEGLFPGKADKVSHLVIKPMQLAELVQKIVQLELSKFHAAQDPLRDYPPLMTTGQVRKALSYKTNKSVLDLEKAGKLERVQNGNGHPKFRKKDVELLMKI